ncbi:MAG: hypothetical protein V2A73_02150, partial [Pseudomonadota bacterium]
MGSVREGRFFADQLSAFTAHERASVLLLRQAANLTSRDDLKKKYEQMGRDTEDHVKACEELIRDFGGDSSYVSPVARLYELRDTKTMEEILLGGSVDVKTMEMACLECVQAATSRSHLNWQFLGHLADKLKGGGAKSKLEKVAKNIQPKKEAQVKWSSDAWERMLADEIV